MMRLFFISVILIQTVLSFGVTRTWTATGLAGNLASNPLNWSGFTAPTATDDVIFNGSSSINCTWDITTVASMSIMAGYNGVVNMGSAFHLITSNLVVNAGTLIATSNILEIDIANSASTTFSFGGGVFNNNGGSVDIYSNSGSNFTFSGNIVLSTLNLYTNGGSTALRTINFGSNLIATDLLFNGFAGRIYDFQGTVHVKSSLDLGDASHTTVSSTNNGTFIFDGASANIIGSTSPGAGKAYLPNIEVNTSGAFDITGSLNVLGNWTVTQGALTAGTSTVNLYGNPATVSGTAVAFSNLNVQSGASVTMPAGETKITGNLVRTGTLSFQPTSVLTLLGTGSQTVNLGGTTLAAINASNTGGARSVDITGAVNVLDSISAQTNVTFNTGGSLTLKATSTLKGRVGRVGGTISGNVTVETFIPGSTTGWTNMGINGVSGQTIANWDTQIPMTCDGCFYSPGAIPGGDFYSITGWNEVAADYDTTITAATALTPGKGFWVYVGSGSVTTTDFTLVNTGPVVQGTLSIPVTVTSGSNSANDGFNLIANPYASPISWTKFFNSTSNFITLDNAIYGWNAVIGGGASTSFVGGVKNPNNSTSIGDIIPAGQGFYVHAPLFSNNVDFDESIKMDNNTGSDPLLKPVGGQSNIGEVFYLKLRGMYDWDETAFRIHSNATAGFDKMWDAYKMFQSPGYVGYPGSYNKYTTISSKDSYNEDYSIQSIPSLASKLRIPILARVSGSGTYTIEATDADKLNDCVMLQDKLLNILTDLKTSNYVFTISDTTSAPRFELILCRDSKIETFTSLSELEDSNTITITQNQQGAFVKTAFEQNTKATISVFNIMGQKLAEDIKVEGTVTTTHLNINLHNQVVFIKVLSEKESVTKKMVLH